MSKRIQTFWMYQIKQESGSGEVPIIELQTLAKQASTTKLVPERKTRQEKIESYQMISKTMQNKISDSIAYMVAVDLLPYTTVEKERFNYLTQTVAPSYKIIGRKALAERKISDLFLRVRETIFNLVEKMPFVAITTVAHFITANWELKTVCLACRYVPADQTAENLADMILEILDEYNINKQKVSACTTDCGANTLAAIAILNFEHISCLGHIFNTTIGKALQL
nr:unnamed protein product [Callosobruchus analis]